MSGGFRLDHAALSAVTEQLVDAATAFDEAGQDVPGAVDAGAATGLVADILNTLCGAGVQLTTDAATLAGVADRCNVDLATTDSEVAEGFLLERP